MKQHKLAQKRNAKRLKRKNKRYQGNPTFQRGNTVDSQQDNTIIIA